MDLSGWIPPEAWAILVMGLLIGGWIVYHIVTFLMAHVSIAFG